MSKPLLLLTLIVFTLSFNLKADIKNSMQYAAEHLSTLNFSKIVGKFGDIKLHRQNSESEQVIFEQDQQPVGIQQKMKGAFDTILDATQTDQRKKDFLECSKGKHAEFFKFGAANVGYVGNRSQYESIVLQRRPDDCFQTVIVNFTNNKHNAINTVTVEVFAFNRTKQFCSEVYVFATASKFHVHTFRLSKHHKFVWKNMNQIDYNNVVTWGIHVFRLCDSLTNWLPDIIQTAEAFVGGLSTHPNIPFFGSKPTKRMQKMSVDFIEAGTGFRWQDRQPNVVNLSQYEVKSGDFLAITRFDGLDQIIQYGAGSHSGHSAMLLEVDGIMNVVQSQDGWYWPKHGIQRNDWETWKKWAHNAGFNVAVLPLSQQSRKNFNITLAAKFFKQMQGFPYGYHNFLFGWIDTPRDNLPPILDPQLILALFSFLERIYEYPIKRIFTQSINKRLGVENRKLSELAVEMMKQNMTIGQLMAKVQKDSKSQKDEWWYSDGPSYVCSSFVAAVYKAGQLIHDIEGVQFTPKDVYTMSIYDINFKVPEKCKRNDPTLPYCQIMGSKLMQLPGYASIQPYPHMAEHCPTMTPDFYRPDGC